MNIKHHLSDALLMAYSAGSLPEAFNLTVAAHVSLCDECRARLGAFEAVGGALIEEVETAPMSQTSLDAALSLIGQIAHDVDDGSVRRREEAGVLPAPIRDYVGGDIEAVNWRPVGMGVKQAILPTAPGAMARLLYIPAGCAVPDHGHRGTELTLVLQGAFADESDHFGPGDIEIADEDMNHTPVAAPGMDCICLAATDAPLVFRGLMPRLAQPFLRI